MRKIKTIGWILAVIISLFIIGFIYTTFFKPVVNVSHSPMNFILFGLVTGGIIVYLIVKLINTKKTTVGNTVTSSHSIVESMKKVFKIVLVEGQLNEVFNYENTKKLLKFIPSTKKALVIVKAKVLIGYDIEKCSWQIDEENKKIKLLKFPNPEILSLDPDFNYYYFEDDLFNFIGRKDLEEIQKLAREQVKLAAEQSELMKIAAEQMKTLLTEIVSANHWQIENIEKIRYYIENKTP